MRGGSDVSPSRSSFLTAFKPRQVILLEQQLKNPSLSAPMVKNESATPVQLKPEEEYTVIFSVAQWLESKGFSKSLKRFLSDAKIKDDEWKEKALNLNEIFLKYMETCHKVHEDLKAKKQEEQLVGVAEANETCLTSEEIEGKKKKKKRTKGNDTVIDSVETLEDAIKSNEKAQEDKTLKKSDEPSHEDKKSKASSNGSDDGKDQSAKKQKDKKKKKDKMTLESDETQMVLEVAEAKPKDSLVETAENGVDESKKVSKKRKKKDTDEKENKLGQDVPLEEPKRKKAKVQEDEQVVEECKVENAQAGQEGSHNFSGKQTDDSTEVALNNNGVDKSGSKSAKKQHKNSAEPKSVNAFQRVKIDEVKFADERLQDNSYWAKDGADIGYGAKAQEVLGQVKGRDFRHEKTKKKRGSYRGGQIDLQSHSIKFNYSDEE